MLWRRLHTGSEYENNNYFLSNQYTRSRSIDKNHDKYHDDSNHNNSLNSVFNTPGDGRKQYSFYIGRFGDRHRL